MEADFDRVVQLNHNTHRLSIEWSRVEPQENEWDEAAVARYPEMLEGLRKRSIEPTVALHHFSTPLWLAQKGGWSNLAVVACFRPWAEGSVPRFGLIALDEKTQGQTVRPSGRLFAAVAVENALTQEMVEEYAAEVSEAVFGETKLNP